MKYNCFLLLLIFLSACKSSPPTNEELARDLLRNMSTNAVENKPDIVIAPLPLPPGGIYGWEVMDDLLGLTIYGDELTSIDFIQIGDDILSLDANDGKTATTQYPNSVEGTAVPVLIFSGTTKFKLPHYFSDEHENLPGIISCSIDVNVPSTIAPSTTDAFWIVCKIDKEMPVFRGELTIYFGNDVVPIERFKLKENTGKLFMQVKNKYAGFVDIEKPFFIDYGNKVRVVALNCS